jgi:hypothetical protein
MNQARDAAMGEPKIHGGGVTRALVRRFNALRAPRADATLAVRFDGKDRVNGHAEGSEE